MPGKTHTCKLTVGTAVYTWNVYKLWEEAKGLPVKSLPLSSFGIDHDYWFDHIPSLRDVAEHCKLIMDADMKYPIIVNYDGQVMDGYHRIAKALVMGLKFIEAIQFKDLPLPDHVERQDPLAAKPPERGNTRG